MNEPVAQKIWEAGEYGPHITELKDIDVGTFLYAEPPQSNLPPVEGDLLPAIGSKVLIHLASLSAWVEHTVVGYYVWESLTHEDGRLHRVFVRVADSDGIINARMLRDVRRVGE